MYRIIEAVEPHMPADKPRYLMGVGTPVNILEAVYRGVDFFDCVMPSRNARHGNLFTWKGKLNVLNEKFIMDDKPIDGLSVPCLPQVFKGIYPPSVQGARVARNASVRAAQPIFLQRADE